MTLPRVLPLQPPPPDNPLRARPLTNNRSFFCNFAVRYQSFLADNGQINKVQRTINIENQTQVRPVGRLGSVGTSAGQFVGEWLNEHVPAGTTSSMDSIVAPTSYGNFSIFGRSVCWKEGLEHLLSHLSHCQKVASPIASRQ